MAAGDGRRRTKRFLHAAGWLTVAPLLAVVAARVVAWDSRSVLVGLNAVTPILFLPAWPVAVVAGVLRRWWLLAAAGLVIVAHVSFVLPELLAAAPVAAGARTAPHFRVFDANVNVANGDVAGYAAEVRHDRPELVILQETTPTFLAALDATGAVADLPYRITAVRTDPFAAAMISRWPLTEDDIVANGGRPFLLRATVRVGEADVRIFGVHAVAAVAGDRERWTEDLRRVRRAVAVESRPVLVVGDFNATWNHRAFRALLDEGLTDAAAARGRPFQMTWPRDLGWVPPLTRIDHVLTTDGLVVTRIGVGEGRGSDHRPLIADVAVVQSSTR